MNPMLLPPHILELDAREPGSPNHPTPGVAREYWPLDLDTWASCEGYGWGANTASLLVVLNATSNG